MPHLAPRARSSLVLGAYRFEPADGADVPASALLTGCAQLSDLSPLAGLTSLRALKLSYYGQLCPLAGLTSLQKLNLYNCGQLTDLSPLAGWRD
jgi:hypothetical protein